jgi:hypothetical protein
MQQKCKIQHMKENRCKLPVNLLEENFSSAFEGVCITSFPMLGSLHHPFMCLNLPKQGVVIYVPA